MGRTASKKKKKQTAVPLKVSGLRDRLGVKTIRRFQKSVSFGIIFQKSSKICFFCCLVTKIPPSKQDNMISTGIEWPMGYHYRSSIAVRAGNYQVETIILDDRSSEPLFKFCQGPLSSNIWFCWYRCTFSYFWKYVAQCVGWGLGGGGGGGGGVPSWHEVLGRCREKGPYFHPSILNEWHLFKPDLS